FIGRVGHLAETDVRFGALEFIAEPFQYRRHHVLLAVLIAPRANPDRDHRVELLLHFPHQQNDLLGAVDRRLNLEDGRHDLLAQNIFAQRSGGDIRHQRGDRVLLLEAHARFGHGPGHLLNVAEPDADTGPAEFDREADLAHFDAAADVVGLDLFSAAARY